MPARGPAPSAQDEDKHYKMCKKIAQLTKVIYTLNNRSEDNEQRVAWLQQMHTAELTRLSQEYEGQVEQLQKHAKALQVEKQQLATSLAQKQRDDLQAAQDAFKERLTALTQQVAEQLTHFDASLRESKQQMAAELAAETKRVREGKDGELAKLVQEYNEKYKAMLAEQLDARDALEDELKQQWSGKVAALEAELAAAHGDKDAQLQAKSKLLQDALQKCGALANEKDNLATSLEAAESHTERLHSQLSHVEESLGAEQQQRTAVEKRAAGLDAELTSLRQQVTTLTASNAESHDALAAESTSHARSKAALQALENEQALLVTAKDGLVHELKDCQAALTIATAERDAARAELQGLHSSSEANASSLSELAGQLASAQQRITVLEDEAAQERMRHADELARAAEDAAAAMATAAEALRATQAQHEEELRAARSAHETTSSSELQKLVEAHERRLAILQDQQRAEVLKLQEELSSLKEAHQATARHLAEAQHQIEVLTQRCEHNEEELRAKTAEAAEDRMRFDDQLSALRRELEAAKSSGVAEVGAQQVELERLRATHAATLAEADSAHARALQEVKEGEAARIEAIQREHAALLQALQKDHSAALQRLRDGAAEAGASKDRDSETRLTALRKTLTEELAAQQAAAFLAEQELRTQIAELQRELQKARADMAASQMSSANQQLQQQQQIAQLQQSLSKAEADAAAALEATRRSAEAQRLDEVSNSELMRQQQVSAERQRYEAAVAAHKEALERLEAKWKDRVALAETQHQSAIAAMTALHANKLQDLTARLKVAHEGQLHAVTAAHEAERAQLQASLEAAEARLNGQAAMVASTTQAIETITAQRDQLQSELTAEQHAHAAALIAAQNRFAADVEELRVAHQQQLNQLAGTHKAIVDDYMRQQTQEREAHKSLLDELRHRLEELQFKYDYRESRAEDVELINRLLQDNKEKEAALVKAHDDMRVYKLELINREENYNKVFRRNPTVADYSGSAEAAGKKGHTTFPVISAARKQSR